MGGWASQGTIHMRGDVDVANNLSGKVHMRASQGKTYARFYFYFSQGKHIWEPHREKHMRGFISTSLRESTYESLTGKNICEVFIQSQLEKTYGSLCWSSYSQGITYARNYFLFCVLTTLFRSSKRLTYSVNHRNLLPRCFNVTSFYNFNEPTARDTYSLLESLFEKIDVTYKWLGGERLGNRFELPYLLFFGRDNLETR